MIVIVCFSFSYRNDLGFTHPLTCVQCVCIGSYSSSFFLVSCKGHCQPFFRERLRSRDSTTSTFINECPLAVKWGWLKARYWTSYPSLWFSMISTHCLSWSNYMFHDWFHLLFACTAFGRDIGWKWITWARNFCAGGDQAYPGGEKFYS